MKSKFTRKITSNFWERILLNLDSKPVWNIWECSSPNIPSCFFSTFVWKRKKKRSILHGSLLNTIYFITLVFYLLKLCYKIFGVMEEEKCHVWYMKQNQIFTFLGGNSRNNVLNQSAIYRCTLKVWRQRPKASAWVISQWMRGNMQNEKERSVLIWQRKA